MPVRYNQDIKVKAIRLVHEQAGAYSSEYAAITAVPRRLGITLGPLGTWVPSASGPRQ